MKNLVIFLFVIIGCGTPKGTVKTEIIDASTMKTVQAKVTYKPFVNKAGKTIPDAGDYFLLYDNYEWFIKFSAGNVLRTDIEKLLDQTTTFKVFELEGLWDTNDPTIQSRVGKYVSIHEIIQ